MDSLHGIRILICAACVSPPPPPNAHLLLNPDLPSSTGYICTFAQTYTVKCFAGKDYMVNKHTVVIFEVFFTLSDYSHSTIKLR